MIKLKNGRAWSERTPDETEDLLRKEMEQLSPAERATLEVVLQELQAKDASAVPANEKRLIDVLGSAEYKTAPVDVRTFVKDPYFLGKTCDNIYPKLLDDLVELFEGGYYTEAIFSGAIGTGKCVDPSTEIYDVSAGRRRLAGQLGPLSVTSVDETSGTSCVKSAESFTSGRKDCVRITLRGGQSVVLSVDHPVLTSRGWVPAAELRLDDLIATPRSYPAPAKPTDVTDELVKLLAYLSADGGCTATITFTNALPEVLKEFSELVYKVADPSLYDRYHRRVGPSVIEAASQNSGKATTLQTSGILPVVRKYGLNCKATEKRIPSEFYGLSNEHVALFLNRFMSCDAHLATGQTPCVEITLASEGLVDDLRFLMLRLGVHSRKHSKQASYVDASGERHVFAAWRLTVYAENVKRLLLATGPVFGKEATSAALLDAVQSSDGSQSNTDVVPIGFDELQSISAYLQERSGSPLPKRFKRSRGQWYSRKGFQNLVAETGYDGPLAVHARSDILWDRIRSLQEESERNLVDLSVPETHCFVGNGIFLHNTFVATIGMCRVLYEISCMRDPHASFGLAPDTNIALVCFSVNESLASKVVYENVVTKLKGSPYFEDVYPFEATKKELRFPRNVWIAPRSSTDTSALGLNTIAAMIDESNFLPRKQTAAGEESRADTLYNTIKRRMKSRFERQGRLPGMLFLVSSKKTSDDFTAKRIKESINDPTVFARDYATWDVKPEDYFKTKRFWVLCGNAETASKILTDDEAAKYKDDVPEGAVLLDVPEDFRHDFESDLEGAIRDIGGISTVAIRPFIQRREKIREAIDHSLTHPFSTQVYDMSKGNGHFLWEQMVGMRTERAPGRVEFQRLRPIISPTAARHIHIDIGLRKDALGLCMSHVHGWKDVVRRTDDGREFSERAPVYFVDLLLRVVPPIGGEILLSEVRHLVYDLSAHGYMITSVTMDQFQSADSMQIFSSRGYRSDLVSVDATPAPYDTLKMALYENRVIMYQYQPLIDELIYLQEDLSGNKRKIDHPPNGSKDTSDALAATLFTLSQQKLVQPLPILKSMSYSGDAWMEEQRQAGMAGNLEASGNSSVMPAFLLGSGRDDGWNGPWRP